MGWFHWQCDDPPWPAELPAFVPLHPEKTSDARVDVDRHGSPNLAEQLEYAQKNGADTLICSVLDGDPALRLNSAVAALHAQELMHGLKWLADSAKVKRIWIAIESCAPPLWVRRLRQEARDHGFKIIELANHYPQADPTLLLYTLTWRRLSPGRLPAECGVILVDAPAAAVLGAQAQNRPQRIPVAVHDDKSGKSFYFEVLPGTEWGEVLSAAGISSEHKTLRAGDPVRDRQLNSSAIISSGELTLYVSPQEPRTNPYSCIRCGWCVQVCPTRAHPALLLEAAQLGDAHRAKRGRLSACIECGVCNQVCPSHLPLLEAIRRIK